MESLLNRISSYNILNNIIPGAVFVYFLSVLDMGTAPSDNVIERVILYYFCGIIVSRVGSLVIEPVFLKLKLISYKSKSEYIEATKNDDLIAILLENNNIYRSFAGLFLVLLISKGYVLVAHHFCISREISTGLVLLALLLLFAGSFRKQTKHLGSRIDADLRKTQT